MRLVKLHLGLFTYLRIELKKSRKPNELVRFLQAVGKSYFQELLKLYKELFRLFDPEFQKQKKQYDNYNKLKIDLQRCIKMLQYLDKKMQQRGVSRQMRRHFWQNFYKDGQVRVEVFNDLLKEIGGK
jgi:methionine salvage enolase-phosphatase E1